MEVYVKESLHVLDYKDSVVDSIFLSDDHMTPGYAYDITITEANTGYSDLKFNMPNMIVDDEGNQIHNPRLKLLTPLVKLRYHRQVYYMGDKPITVREPQGYGDKVSYVDKTYSNKYPENIIEDYIMDYIVQPVDKKRDVLKLTTSFTAIDYPRFNLSKKKVGLNISQDTLTNEEWTLYQNKPMDVAGTIKYQQWTNNLTVAAGGDTTKVPLEWWPDKESEYPLDEDMITTLMNNTASWPYGLLGTAFYWPIKSTARFEGTMYKEGGFLVLQLYDFYSLTTEGVSPEKHVGRYAWEWTQLYEVDSYLTPNRADNYLFHILEGTNWSVKMREDGTPDVDIVQVDIPNPAGSTTSTTQTDHTCNISVSNSNCYNAITAVCKGLQLYPVFDCVHREVSLKAFAGKNYGLSYQLGLNLKSNGTKLDGEKVITKLYVTGGKDYQGDQNINIGEAERSYFEPSDNPDERDPWNPNDPEYIIKRSPYGTNYILNFKWMYDNKWITKEEILDLYDINQKINDLNKEFMIPYTEDRLRTLQMYNDAVNQYDLKQGEYKSTLNSMMNKYYKVYGEYSEGTFYAFHKAPLGLHPGTEKENLGKQCLWIGHCSKCKETWSSATKPTQCTCGNTDIKVDEVYIPLYADFKNVVPPSNPQYPYGPSITAPEYEPYLKGDYLKLVTTLDNENGDWSITDYESRISLITPIPYRTGATIDDREYLIDGVYVKASSGNIEEWNEDIKLFVVYYGEMLDALDTVNYCLEKLAKLEEEYNEWKAEYDGYHAEIQDKYGDYIIEGNYTNAEQPYVGLLFREGVEASDKYSIPEITYNLDVIDSSGLIEYRQPMTTTHSCSNCNHVSYTPFTTCPKCGDTTIIATYDTYNDLVHMLHSVGQIVPKAGDYVAIYDEPMGMYGVPGLITEISRTIDKPINNKIKLDTGYTDDEELVGNIITATNTVLNNADIYARTAVLKADGTIDSGAISQTLNNPNANISIAGTNGNMLLTGSYLRFTDPTDNKKAIKYSGTGIFTTTTLDENGESVEWQKMLTPTGINATYLNAGQIDTKHINIMSGMTSKILIDQYGMVVKDRANKSAHIVPFDTSQAKTNAAYASQWGIDNNISGFMGVDSNNNALLYTKGFLVANEGSNIANWITSNEGFYHLNNTTKDLWLSPGGIDGTVNSTTATGTNTTASGKFAIYANGNFAVTTGGKLYAKDAVLSGSVTASSGKIAGYTITGDTLYGSQVGMDAESGDHYAFWAGADVNNSSSAPFRVGHDGSLRATKADIEGDISAKSLTLADGIKIAEGHLVLTDTLAKISANTTEINSAKVRITANETAIQSRVTFYALKTAGSTVINGANITTGTVDADRIDVDGLFAKEITATGTITGATLKAAKITSTNGNFAVSDAGDLLVKGNLYTYGDGGTYSGWHTGVSTPNGFVVCRDIDLAVGQYVTMYFNNGIYVGFRGGRD